MQYSEEFKKKVLSLKNIKKDFMTNLLDQGLQLVGPMLAQYEGVSAIDIVAAYESKNFEGIYERAKDKLVAEELYNEWMNTYYPQWRQEFYGEMPSQQSDEGKKSL